MKEKKPIRAGRAVAVWLCVTGFVIWTVFAVVITWCTAITMDRYLEKENGELASNIVSAAQLQRLAQDPTLREETQRFWLWDGVNSHWLNNSFEGGLLRRTTLEPQTAAVIYDGNGTLLEKNENAFYLHYITEENWHTQQSDMAYDGVAIALYDPSEITQTALQVIWRTDWIALRFTGTLSEGYLIPSKIEYISCDIYRDIQTRYYADGSYERHSRIQQMEEKYGLTWETLLISSYDAGDQETYYTLSGHASYYDAGDSLEVDGVVYENLMDYVLQIRNTSVYNDYYSFKRGDLWDTLLTDSMAIYGPDATQPIPAYRVVAAVRYSPMKLAMESLLYVYIGTFCFLCLIVVLLWRQINHKLILPVKAFDEGMAQGWKAMRYQGDQRRQWREVSHLEQRYYQIREERTKQKDEITRLNTALEYARAAEQTRRQMTSNIAHELKTPLAVVHSYAEGLKEHIAEQKRDKYVDVILQETEHMDSIVLEMLDLSRLEAGKVKLSRDEFSLGLLSQGVFDKLERAAQAKELQVKFSFPGDTTVTADEGRIAQVIENFAANAIKYTPVGGRIQVRIRTGRGWTRFSIENESAAFTQEALEKVWEPFYRTEESRSGEGTGLGLAIVKNIIELHDGKCSVRNTGTGVEFSFTI